MLFIICKCNSGSRVTLCCLFTFIQTALAKWHLWQQFRGWNPDPAKYLLLSPVSGPDRHVCPCGLWAGCGAGQHRADGAQQWDSGYDPARSGLPAHLIMPPGLQRFSSESLTGSAQHPKAALDPSIDTQPLLYPHSVLPPPDPRHSHGAVWECCSPLTALSYKLAHYLGKIRELPLIALNRKKGVLRLSMTTGSQMCSNPGETELLLCDASD